MVSTDRAPIGRAVFLGGLPDFLLGMQSLFQDLDSKPLPADPPEYKNRKTVRRLLFALLILLAAIIGGAAGMLLVYTTGLPQVEDLEHYRPISITQLYDDEGKVIGSFALQRRVVASYDDFPPVLRDALISIEDKDFYRHWGVNVWRIAGAAYHDIQSGGKVQGASTLTMQLARNLFLSPDRSWHRKIEEALLAVQIERRFTKAQIFTLYANQVYLGHGAYGFEAASEYLFQQTGQTADSGRSRTPGRAAKIAQPIFADQPSGARPQTAQSGHQFLAGRRQNHRASGQRRSRRTSATEIGA